MSMVTMAQLVGKGRHAAEASIKIGKNSGLSNDMEIRAESSSSFTFTGFHIQPVLLISFPGILPESWTECAEILHDIVHGFFIGELHMAFSHGCEEVIERKTALMTKK